MRFVSTVSVAVITISMVYGEYGRFLEKREMREMQKVRPEVSAVTKQPNIIYTPVDPFPVDKVIEVDSEQLHCMALNMYFEARNQESDEAYAAVGYTVLNRVSSSRYPDTICDVVFQGHKNSRGGYIHNKCQFSWVCDGLSDTPNTKHPIERMAWERANEVAFQVLTGSVDNPVGNATMYHANYVKPYWSKAYKVVGKIDDHIFYERRSTKL